MVGLFSPHANELKKLHQHLTTKVPLLPAAAPSRHPRKQAQIRLSGVRAQEVTSEYQAGKTVYQIAAEIGCHRTTVSEILKRRGIALRGASPTAEQTDAMVSLYQTGLSLAKVGKQLGFNARTVLAQLRLRGVPTRSR